jgi:hypothetical protein
VDASQLLQGVLILLVWWLARAENHHLKVKSPIDVAA